MQANNKYKYYKWINLISFSLFYNTVYIGRFNLNSVLGRISQELLITDSQQTMLYISVFIAYALGSLINGRLIDKYRSKDMVFIGAIVSIISNALILCADKWGLLLVLSLFNGYFQSMIWLGGIKIISHWWSAAERGISGGIANFFSGLSHVTSYMLPSLLALMYPHSDWRTYFIIPVGIMFIFLVLFYSIAKSRPEDAKLPPYNEPDNAIKDMEDHLANEPQIKVTDPWKHFFNNKKFRWWCAIAMLSSLCRYGLLKWIPLYYSEKAGGSIMGQYFSILVLPLGMAFGTLILSWIAGRRFYHNTGIIIILSAALCGTLVIIFPTMNSANMIMTGVFCTGFFLYGINGILWIYAMNVGGRRYAGTAAGILNCFAYLGATAEVFLFPAIIRVTGNMISIFIAMEAFCIAMVICGITVSEKETLVEAV